MNVLNIVFAMLKIFLNSVFFFLIVLIFLLVFFFFHFFTFFHIFSIMKLSLDDKRSMFLAAQYLVYSRCVDFESMVH